jgi:hypothetical protein
MNDNDSIRTTSCDGGDKCVAFLPRTQIISIALVAVYCEISLARIGFDECETNGRLFSRAPDEIIIKIIQDPLYQ